MVDHASGASLLCFAVAVLDFNPQQHARTGAGMCAIALLAGFQDKGGSAELGQLSEQGGAWLQLLGVGWSSEGKSSSNRDGDCFHGS